ncbi:MAG: lipopolysaccharide heptosyltransferase I [Candidatus Thiodiazotropha sp. (ex Monitilora ramsayi)]|nr:lipopolysaccharide heptosyltransferase I [Candidatus Thiodiazotropha sp. (ex Monitilora ramsayi)]
MKALVIKTSSLGDVIHTLPALSDASENVPDIRFDWVVEEAFAEIPAWHPAVDRVIPVALRRWRRSPWTAWRSGDLREFRRLLRQSQYDAVIDAQGLLKSALITSMSRGPSYGLDRQSAREPLASRTYRYPLTVARGQHAIARVRQLFALALDYDMPGSQVAFGIDLKHRDQPQSDVPYLVFLHGTTWQSKHYPEKHWCALARRAAAEGYRVLLPWGNDNELVRAQRIAGEVPAADPLPGMGIGELAAIIAGAAGVVAVDTGLAHLACALSVPAIALFGPTNPALTGVIGDRQHNLSIEYPCMPCLKRACIHKNTIKGEPVCLENLPPGLVFDKLIACIKGVE